MFLRGFADKKAEKEGGQQALNSRVSLVAIEPLRDDFRFCGLFKEMTLAIFYYLPWSELVRSQLVCKGWRSLICTTDELWTTKCLARGLPVKAPFNTFMDALWHFAHDETTQATSLDQWGQKEQTPQQKKVLNVYRGMTKQFGFDDICSTSELPQSLFPHFRVFAIQHFGFQHVGHMQFMINYNDEYYLLRNGDLCQPYYAKKETLEQSDQSEAMSINEIFDENRCLPSEVITKVAADDLRFLLEGFTNLQMRKSILRLLCAMNNHTKHHQSIRYPRFLHSYEDPALPEDWRVIVDSVRRAQKQPLRVKVIKEPKGNDGGQESYRSKRHKFKYKEGDVLQLIGTAKAVNKWYAVNSAGTIGPIDPEDVTIIESAGIGIDDLVDLGERMQYDKERRVPRRGGKWTLKGAIPDSYPPSVTWNEETKEWHLQAIVYCKWPGLYHFMGSVDQELKALHLVVGRGELRYYEESLLSCYKQGTALS